MALGCAAASARAQVGPAEGKEGLVDLGRFDERLKGHYAPKGFKVQIIASEPTIIDPTGMAFDDQGNLYVAEWKKADHMLDTWDTIPLPEGGTARIQRRRKATLDVVKRLTKQDKEGVYHEAEVVVDGAEMPSSIFPWKKSLYLTCVGRLERWSDEDGDGKFETRTILADGFCGFYHHWLSGMTLNADGWFYLTAGDNDNHIVGADGSRVEVSRCGTIVRSRVDGSQMHCFAIGFRNPYRDVAFNGTFDMFQVDNDQEDGSKFQGVRFINPVEEGDYGWRLRPGASCCQADFDRGALSGELPGKLPILAKTGRGAPAGLVIYNGTALPERYRDLAIYPDVFRKLVRGYRTVPQGGSYAIQEEIPLMTADDDLFRPCQAVVGPDGALYVLDWRSNSGGAGRLWGDGRWGRIYRITWEGDGETPALPTKPNNWKRVLAASDAQLLEMMRGRDYHEARRAQRELVSRGAAQRGPLLALLNDDGASLHARLLGLQGARQLWNTEVENAMIRALDDPRPEIRRLAAQALSWEPSEIRPRLIPILVAHLDDRDGRALRDIALALGRHGQARAEETARHLLGWLLEHPDADVVTRDAFIRALERLGHTGVEAVAEAIRQGQGEERSRAIAIYICFRTSPAARRLPVLAQQPGLTDAERAALIRQFKDIPLNIPVPTQGLADWVATHRAEVGPAVKVAALDVCRLAGNPAPALVVKLLDDPDETVRLAATQLAAQTRPAGAGPLLWARVADRDRSAAERLAIARALRIAGPAAFPALEEAYQAFADDSAFRKILRRAMAEPARAGAGAAALAALAEGAPEVRAEAIQILGESPPSALQLGRAFLDGQLPRADLPAVREAIRKYNTAEHRELLSQIDAAAAQETATFDVAELKERVQRGADPWKGLAIFRRETGVRCATCHKIENFGGNVGPALTGVSQALSLDKLIEAVLEPSKEIKEGYESYKVALQDGRVLSGIKVAQDDQTLTLRDANGQEMRLPISEIDEQMRESTSLMPVGLVADLSLDELADLLAFLQSPPAQATLRHRQRLDHWLAIGPFSPGPDDAPFPLDAVDPSQRFAGQVGTLLSWVPLDASTWGLVNLRGQFGLNPGRAYLATQIRSETDQDAALRFALDGPSRIYLNGTKVGEAPGQPRVNPQGPFHLAHLPLKAGWNTLLIAVDRPNQGEGQAIIEIGTAQAVAAQSQRP
ncbi:MAG: hypothetical protein IRY99_10100 [Isosphaeraceae bacterium]|nr:hypothetical protein [Isosphaeraceae bacterium]